MRKTIYRTMVLSAAGLALPMIAWGGEYVPPQAYTPPQAQRPSQTPQEALGRPPVAVPNGGGGQAEAMPVPIPPPDLVQMGIDSVAPMNAEQVRSFMNELYRRQMAGRESFSGRPPPKPVTTSYTLDLSPGSTPPVVRVAVGQGSVLSFTDLAGRPWEIVDNINFHGGAYDVKLIAPHLYTIALKEPAAANMTVVLKDLPRPIVVTVVPAQTEVDYLVEFTVPRFIDGRPPASALVTAADASSPHFHANDLISYLYRTPPKQAKALRVEGLSDVMAWQSGPNTMVVRTDGLLMLPAWLRRHASTDGVSVYEIPLSPTVAIARGGQVLRGTVSGFLVGAESAPSVGYAAQ